VANIGASIAKDSYYTRWFGTGSGSSIPLLSKSLFGVRDMVTIFSSFSMVDPVTKAVRTVAPLGDYELTRGFVQVFLPVGVQLFTVPLHLIGIDLHNRPAANTSQRMQLVKREYWKTAAGRQLRIGCALGVGGVANRAIKMSLYSRFLPHAAL
jgi:hypothetical protein